jgi:nucleoside-diphosphate-sugar epimerase
MARMNARLVDELCERVAAEPDRGWTGARLIHAVSALEYGRVAGPLSESTRVDPTTDYGRTKYRGTQALHARSTATGLRALVARLFTVYGPGEHSGRLLPALMHTARSGVRLELTGGRQHRCFTYVEDVAEGLLRLGTSAARPGEVVNLATGRLSSVRDFAEAAAVVLGFDAALLDFGALPDRDDEMWHGEVDVARLRGLTSWSPQTTIADGIRRSWEFTNAL